jgi:hypothetical protein
MMRLITRLALVAARVGLAASVVAHALSFQHGHEIAPAWFFAVFFGIFPLGAVGLLVCYRVGTTHGIWGSREQWVFFDRSVPEWLTKVRTTVFVYAMFRFVWFAVTDSSDAAADSGVPLGLFSAFTAAFYVTFLTILKVDLSEANVIRPADQ